MGPGLIAAWCGGILGVVGVITAAWRFTRMMARFVRRILDFLDDWRGEPARAGRPAEPGVLERLSNVETAVQSNTQQVTLVSNRVKVIEGELKPNGGSSFRDRVDRALPDDPGA